MERELWPLLYHHLQCVAERFRQKYVQMQPWVLVATMLWAAIHDRPICWACQESNWDTTRLRPLKIPSAATMSRRIDRVGTGLFWNALQQELQSVGRTDLELKLIAYMDGKPLPVGNYSKDPDARWGHAAGRVQKGYKLHAIWSFSPLPDAWEVTPLNVNEKTVARRLIPQMSGGGGYLLADGEYDASDLYDIAHERGYQLISPYRKAKKPGGGHHRQSPYRLRSITLLNSAFGKTLYGLRTQIERDFGNAASFGGGLAPLVAWIRGLDRVRTWTWAKLLINAARILKNQDLRQPCKMLDPLGIDGPVATSFDPQGSS